MKRLLPLLLALLCAPLRAERAPVMLQGFYWDSYADTQWSYLEGQADEIGEYFTLLWVPQSGYAGSTNNMGYMPQYYFRHDSSFGSEAQLRSMITTLREKGVGAVADVVVNHRNALGEGGSWVDFPEETYQGHTYRMLPSDICANDDGGKTATWAATHALALSAHNDTGDDWDGCRDLDHTSPNVQTVVKAYLHYLLEDLGYAGFRYDMVKGFAPEYVAAYNRDAQPAFSVGECWDGTARIRQWIDGTERQSQAFDFPFRYRVRDAINTQRWSALASSDMLLWQTGYAASAVTFVENHDTERRTSAPQDPILRDTLQANAFMLAMPGTPCVFLRHWQDCKRELKSMIEARQLAHITPQSEATELLSSDYYYAVKTADLVCVVGRRNAVSPTNPTWSQLTLSPSDYTEVITAPGYRYMLARTARTPWIDAPSGIYSEAFDTRVMAVSDTTARLVYTLDGTEPTPQSPTVESGATLHIDATCTLKVGLVIGSQVIKTLTHRYTLRLFTPHTATVYLLDPAFTPVYFYAWDDNGPLLGPWPGTPINATKTLDGRTWYYHTFDIPREGYTFNIIFDRGNGQPQTADIGHIDADRYFSVTQQGGRLEYTDLTTPVQGIQNSKFKINNAPLYDLTGRRVAHPQKGHIYIRSGKKAIYNAK